MDRNDFDRKFKRAGQIGSALAIFVAAFWVGIMGLIVWVAYSFATADPKQVAREAGAIVKEFSDPANQEQP